jgi:hypothetical protein
MLGLARSSEGFLLCASCSSPMLSMPHGIGEGGISVLPPSPRGREMSRWTNNLFHPFITPFLDPVLYMGSVSCFCSSHSCARRGTVSRPLQLIIRDKQITAWESGPGTRLSRGRIRTSTPRRREATEAHLPFMPLRSAGHSHSVGHGTAAVNMSTYAVAHRPALKHWFPRAPLKLASSSTDTSPWSCQLYPKWGCSQGRHQPQRLITRGKFELISTCMLDMPRCGKARPATANFRCRGKR